MDISKGESFRLGVFLAITIAILFGLLAFVVGKKLWEKQDEYYTIFNESVDGLVPGSSVKLNGVDVGQITNIEVDPDNIARIIVEFEVHGTTPMRPGMQANLVGGISITGLKKIELTGGDNSAPRLKPGTEIPSGISQMKQLTGQAEQIALKFENMLNNFTNITNDKNQRAIANILKNVNKILIDSDTLINELKAIPEDVSKTLASVEKTTEDIRKAHIGKKLDQTFSNANILLKDMQKTVNSLDNKITSLPLRQTTESFMSAAKSFESTSKRADLLVYKVQNNLTASVKSLKSTMENLNDFSKQINDNPSVLLRGDSKKGRDR